MNGSEKSMLIHHLEKLRHFSGSVKAGSIRSYSLANNLSQPSVSKSIQLLEEALESSLLVRSREGIELTSAGKLLFDFSESVHSNASQVEDEIRKAGQQKYQGVLTMGTYQSIAVYFVPKFFQFIQKTQGGIRLNLLTASSDELVKSVKSGKIDFIVSIDPPKSPDLSQIEIYKDTYSLYKKSGMQTNSSDTIIFTLSNAKDHEGRTLENFLKQSKLSKNISDCGDFESVKAMVEEGVGWAFMPERVAAPLLFRGLIEKVSQFPRLNSVGSHSIVFSCRKHRMSDRAMKWVSEQLISMMRSKKTISV
jgi:DNA-binding transcriptional LysR family regulator